ncbi:LysR family transcriptional regulator [Gilliamella sp. Pra-s65]|uniref:LysR family transcriptional regulator n=1 Tax=unclassified Gilliamella TaxID=2685620 RepID=UPI001365E6EC|nr:MULTISPECIES: LysR family transcriptional regulator [unclassified Gilliamella]MWN90199.1 LysR family transcriptional regulator [Gilliamella sp. Pra-s65]MWP47667.1 LysR family transcriptional regulator [Gilliamella sp. Pas-s27]MWP73118.1 LysR family transcriptional regulator [Gilliamella sp. Pra-s52]
MLEIKILRYFLALAKEESITAAANNLHLTQPTLSRQLMELEQSLGTPLFIRGSRRITLTDEGIRLRKRAEEILELVHKTESEFQSLSESVCGDIYIGCAETDAMKLVVNVIKLMQDSYPQIRIHIYSGNANDVSERIDKGLLDFGVLIEPSHLTKYESLCLPQQDTWGVLMRKDCALANLKVISPSDLQALPLIVSQQKYVSDSIEKWFKLNYEKLNITATYNLIFNAALMVEQNIGYALCLDKLINTAGNTPLCFRPLYPKLQVDVNIVWKKHHVFSKAAELFLKQLKEHF